MSNIKVLDCTLREGGYVNNWNFKYENICEILSALVSANIDFIETGFFKSLKYNKDKSIFSNISQLEEVTNNISKNTLYTLMINYGEYDIHKIPVCENDKILLRVAFKKEQCSHALDYCKKLKNKGYGIFINPMHTNIYNHEELLNLVEDVNTIAPFGFTVTDTTGSMKEEDLISIISVIDENLDNNIKLCFHSHNNLQLSLANSRTLIDLVKNRELIIDSTLLGMGRGAGNLCTEVIIKYLNEYYNKSYNISPIYNVIDNLINPIFKNNYWGYSVPYYLTAINKCHPNYAKYLLDKYCASDDIIEKILLLIPQEYRANYNPKIIDKIFSDK